MFTAKALPRLTAYVINQMLNVDRLNLSVVYGKY